MSTNVLNKLNIEVEAPSEMNGKQLQSDVSYFVKNNLIKKIDTILSKFGTDKNLRVSKLEIVLPALSSKNWEQDFEEKFSIHLQRELENLNQEKITDASSSKNKTVSGIELFIFYLKNGTYPWWAKISENTQLKSILKKNIRHEKFISLLSKTLKENPHALKRLIFQLGDKELVQLLFVFSKIKFSYSTTLKKLQKTFSDWWKLRAIRLVYWQMAFETTFDHSKNNKILPTQLESEILKNTILYFFSQKNINPSPNKEFSSQLILAKLKSVFQKKEFEKDGNLFFLLKKDFKKENSLQVKPAEAANFLKKENQNFDKKPNLLKNKKKSTKNNNNTLTNPNVAQPLLSDFYIHNAGLVILHPFLQYLFEEINLTKHMKFIDDFHHGQAVLLTQYLVNGKLDFFEPELILNKVLCNFPISQAIESKLILNKEQLEEGEKLLKATITHWAALKNSSPEGLRNSFLQREGKLSKKENGDWKLIIPPQGMDILLSKLPWGFHMIKLPWMESKLFVDWH